MKPAVPRVHAVTNPTIAALPNLETRARAIAGSAAVALHARLPHADGGALIALVRVLQRAAAAAGALTFVNDRADVAAVARSEGVHLPASGLPIALVRRLVGPDVLIGRSAHSADAARRAGDDGADYAFLGPIWPTPSHPGHPGLGLEVLGGLGPIRAVAIGGITPERARSCRDAGAWGVAAITALWAAPDPHAAAEEMLLSFAGD